MPEQYVAPAQCCQKDRVWSTKKEEEKDEDWRARLLQEGAVGKQKLTEEDHILIARQGNIILILLLDNWS